MKKFLSVFLCLALLCALPAQALAAGPDETGLCEHHTAHDEACGYRAPTEEIPCDKGCTDTNGDGVIDHAEDCAYTPAQAGSPCTYVCELCAAAPQEPEPSPAGEGDEEGGGDTVLSSTQADEPEEHEGDLMPLSDPDLPLTVEGGAEGTAYKFDGKQLTVLDGANVKISLTSGHETADYTIKIVGSAQVTISGLTIKADGAPAIDASGATAATIHVEGSNSLTGGANSAAIAGPAGGTLTLDGEGSVTAAGGSNAPGISGKALVSSVASLTANGSGKNAGIKTDSLSLSGGTVTAAAGAEDQPALSAAPVFDEYTHLSLGNTASNTAADTPVEWTGNSLDDWAAYHWVQIAPMTVNSLSVAPQTSTVVMNDGKKDDQTIQFAAKLNVSASGKSYALELPSGLSWSLSAVSSGTEISDTGKLSISDQQGTGTITVTAKYTADKEVSGTASVIVRNLYTITFDPNGGSCNTKTGITNPDGTLSNLPTATKTGVYFAGWYTQKEGGTKVSTTTVFNANATVYAHWSNTPVTGDANNPLLWAALLGGSALVLVLAGVVFFRKKRGGKGNAEL